PLIARRDAWPPTGGPPGSDLDFMRKQHLDPLDVEYGILQVLDLFIFSQQNLEFGAAIQRAINDWQLAFWSDRDPRLKASILAGQDDTEFAIAEIERCAKIGRYVQINVCPRANEPLGRRRYWPIYARAQELGLPLGIHVGGYGGHAPTGGGWPSYYAEEHQSNAHTMAAQLTSLVLEGIPERFPNLKIVFIVNGEFFALLNRCPHAGAPLEKAACVARLTSPEPGVYQRSRVGELLRCAWHGWEFDMRNGQSYFDPNRVKIRSYPVAVESGEELAKEMGEGR